MVVLVLFSVEEKPLLSISSCSWLMIVPFKDFISCLNPYISDIIIIFGGMKLKSGVSSVLFQVCAIRANDIISLGMSIKIGDACK